ncbi:hypothetical protein AB6A40_006593 [Gnathostoma spinigerum]|uniref:Uncharacterized protein n=1 Tax=Gnathostoma spinigerum TaxID=75299 RepID=A0ABD6EP05_9BILA
MFCSKIHLKHSGKDFPLRTPTYDTSFQSIENLQPAESHPCDLPIVGVHVFEKAGTQSNYPIASIDEAGSVTVWNVFKVTEDSAVWDIGLRPNGRIRMKQIAIVSVERTAMSIATRDHRIFTTSTVRAQHEQLLIGTSSGYIFKIARNKECDREGPRVIDTGMRMTASITTMRISPYDSSVFMVGLSNGHISLHQLTMSDPILSLVVLDRMPLPVTSAEWSPGNPGIIYSFHGGIRLVTWNLEVGREPISSLDISNPVGSPIVSTRAWSELSASGSRTSSVSYLAFATTKGIVQRHLMNDSRTSKVSSFKDIIQSILKKI